MTSTVLNKHKQVLNNVENNLILMRNYLIGLGVSLAQENASDSKINSSLFSGYSLPRWGNYKDKALLNEIRAFTLHLRAKLNAMDNINRQAGLNKAQREMIANQFVLKYTTSSPEWKKINKVKQKVANEFLTQEKKKDLDSLLSADSNEPNVFFLLSSHVNAAKDHEPFQGKMYVDENYAAKIHDTRVLRKVRGYIKRNQIRTVQWVTGAPVYMIFRPHCRHYFTPIPIHEVLRDSIPVLEKRYHTLVENKGVKTNSLYRKHKNKLRLLRKLPQTPIVRAQMKKERALVNKYAPSPCRANSKNLPC